MDFIFRLPADFLRLFYLRSLSPVLWRAVPILSSFSWYVEDFHMKTLRFDSICDDAEELFWKIEFLVL